MEISYSELENEIIEALEKNPIWVLSTSLNDYVTSRPMSIVHIGLDVFFQTNTCYVKHEQMKANKHVALCSQNISIEGIAEDIGDWSNGDKAEIMELYKSKHKNSFDAYGMLNGQTVYKVTPVKIKLWKYVDGKPTREVLLVVEQQATRLYFM